MRTLVTGASGFIGTHLCNALEENNVEVVRLSLPDGDLAHSDIAKAAMRQYSPDRVVHLAALVGRAFGEVTPARTVDVNARATLNVAQACGRLGIPLAYASTSEVYGDNGSELLTEDSPMALPHNLYGLTKRWGEEVCRLYAPDELTIWRLSMPYGPGLPPGEGRAMVTSFLADALAGRPLYVHRGASRSLCYVSDAVRGLLWTLERPGVWNIGRDDEDRSVLHIARLACELAQSSTALIEVVPPPTMQTVVKRLSVARLRSLGWRPYVGLEEGMSKTLDWLRDRRS